MDRRMTALQKSANAPINRTVDKIHLVALGLLGFVVDLVVTTLLYSQDFSLGSAQFSGFLMASGAGYFLSLSRLFKDRATQKKSDQWINFITTTLLILFLRGGILATLIQFLNFSPQSALLVSIAASSIFNQIGHTYPIFSQGTIYFNSEIKWYYFSVAMVIYAVLLLSLIHI